MDVVGSGAWLTNFQWLHSLCNPYFLNETLSKQIRTTLLPCEAILQKGVV